MGQKAPALKILISGGQGFLGAALTRALVERGGHDLLVTARRPAPELEALGVTVARVDLRDREAVLPLAQGVDLIFHTAAKAGIWGAYDDYHGANVLATEHLLEAARRHGVPYFVHTSSPSVTFAGRSEVDVDETAPYSSAPLNPYCLTKILSEKAVLTAHGQDGLETLALRPHLIYGPGDPHLLPRVFEAAASRSGLIRVGDGLNRVDVTHISDAVGAHLAALDRRHDPEIWGRPYFITSGRPVLLWEWLEQLLAWKSLPGVRRSLGLRQAVLLGTGLQWLYRLLRLSGEPRLTRFSALQLGCSHTYSIAQARQRLGYIPAVDPFSPFEEQFRS